MSLFHQTGQICTFFSKRRQFGGKSKHPYLLFNRNYYVSCDSMLIYLPVGRQIVLFQVCFRVFYLKYIFGLALSQLQLNGILCQWLPRLRVYLRMTKGLYANKRANFMTVSSERVESFFRVRYINRVTYPLRDGPGVLVDTAAGLWAPSSSGSVKEVSGDPPVFYLEEQVFVFILHVTDT